MDTKFVVISEEVNGMDKPLKSVSDNITEAVGIMRNSCKFYAELAAQALTPKTYKVTLSILEGVNQKAIKEVRITTICPQQT